MSKTTQTAAAARTRSEAISASWQDKKVRAARMHRDQVQVGRYVYRSVPAAFEELGLPMSKMIKFRLHLKREGVAKFDGKTFRIVKVEG